MKSIATKLLISIGITTILFFLFLSYHTYSLVRGRVNEVVEQQASMALKFDVAIRDYIAQHVRPVMYKLVGKDKFMPETMSTSFVARTIFEDVRKEFPDYIIKFSSDNPRNPANQAGTEELKIIDYFNDNPQMQRWEGEISINNKPYFAKFSAMRMEEACLRCHGDPENAPASLLKRYGSTASFHRPLGKVIGMDTIAIPMVKITEQLWPELRQAFFLIALGLLPFFLSIIFLTRFIVTKRLSSITKHFLTAAQQSNYQEIAPIEVEGNDEIRDLAVSFNSLSDRLKIFYCSLETQVKDRTQELADKNEQMKQEIEERKQAEGALRTSEHFLKTLLNAIPIPVFYKDKNGRYLGFNKAFETFCGETRKGLIGKTVFEINPPELAEIYHARDNELFERGRVQKYEFQVKNAHGVLRDVIFNKALFFDSQKSISGLIGAILDITDLKKVMEELHKSELKYKTLIDNIDSGVVVYEVANDGEDFIIVDFNKSGEEIENIRKEDLIGKSVLDVFPGIKEFGLFDVFKRVWKTGKPEYFPITFYEDGRISGWRENYVYKLPSKEIIAVYDDKTEQKKSEKALQESEEKYRNLFNNAEVGMFRTRIDGSEILEMNEKFLEIFGRTREEMLSSPSVIYWADQSEREEMVRRLELEVHVPNFECRMLNKQGEVRSCLTSLRLYREQEILEGSIVDITERKQVEKALLESEALFRNLVDSAPEGIFVQAEGRFLFLNPSMVSILGGNSAEELIGTELMARIAPNYHEDVRSRIRFQKEMGKPSPIMDMVYLRLDGSKVSVETTAVPIRFQDQDAHLVFVRDITERKQAEKNLLESEKRFSTIFSANPAAIAVTRLDNNRLVNVNQAWQNITGYTLSEVVNHTPLELNLWVLPAQQERQTKMLREQGMARDEVQIRQKSGEIIEMLFSAQIIELSGESYLLTMSQDITDRKKAEADLRDSEKKYRSMMESFSDPLYICSPDLKIKYMNPKMTERSGRDAIGEPCYSVLHGNSNKCEWCDFDKVIEGETVETNIKSPLDGRDYRVTSMPIRNQDGTIYKMAIYKDITDYLKAISEREETQMQLIQSQKMESIGSLAGGIAHDFNNLLTTIIGNADFALDQAGENRSLYNEIEEIRKAGRQAAALTRQLLAFSRKQIIQPDILNLNDILENTEKMLRRTIGEDIEFKTMFAPDLWSVKMDPGQIEQIIMNLVVNARDAMLNGGKLTIETANTELDDVYFQNRTMKSRRGSYVMITVTDTGIGMDKETQSRIFEPFFTTKERDQGTGLGLSTVYGIVKQNNGHIRADSEPGKGTTFKIYFPRIKADEAPEIEEQMDENRLKGSETLLVVEDNKTLLKLTQKMLESYGYNVLTAQSANEAVEIFNRHDGLIHLLLTDVVLPGMNGRKLAVKIISKYPKVKVLYMSGYTDDTISNHGVLYDDIEFIEKPFSQKNMGLKVRNLLDEGIDD